MHNFGGDSFAVMRFDFGNSEFGNGFVWQSIPEKDFFAVWKIAEGLATRDNLGNFDRGGNRSISLHILYYTKICYNIKDK